MIIQKELIEKYLLGEADFSETMQVELAAGIDDEVAQKLLIAKRFEKMAQEDKHEELPLERMAAQSKDNQCVILCERHILNRMYPDSERTLWTEAKEAYAYLENEDGSAQADQDGMQTPLPEQEKQWLTQKGTALYNIGRILESGGLSITRSFFCQIGDLKEALTRNEGVIVAVNQDILSGQSGEELPDHAVCVLEINEESVRLYNPYSQNQEDVYPIQDFMRAWETSRRFAVFADKKDRKVYDPHATKVVENVELDDSLEELQEALAEFVHDIWAEKRFKEGFIYGPENNTDPSKGPKTNKDLIPYSDLPESEKNYDRNSAMMTLQLVHYLGYNIEKSTGEGYVCPDCGKGIKLEWSYCPHCGRFIELSDFKGKD